MENQNICTCKYCPEEDIILYLCAKCHEHLEKQKYMEENPHEFVSCYECDTCIHIGSSDCLDKIHVSEVEEVEARRKYVHSREYQERIALEIYGIILL